MGLSRRRLSGSRCARGLGFAANVSFAANAGFATNVSFTPYVIRGQCEMSEGAVSAMQACAVSA
jgi:hypothetical protein